MKKVKLRRRKRKVYFMYRPFKPLRYYLENDPSLVVGHRVKTGIAGTIKHFGFVDEFAQ